MLHEREGGARAAAGTHGQADEPARDDPARDDPAREDPARGEPARDQPQRDQPAHEQPSPREMRRLEGLVERCVDATLAAAPVPINVLDVGCGTGMLLRALSLRLPSTLTFAGIDPSARSIAHARHLSDPRFRYARARAEQLPFESRRFDLAVCVMSIGYWRDPLHGLREVARVLQPAGRLVLIDRTAGRAARRSGVTDEWLHAIIRASGLHLDYSETIKRRRWGTPEVRAFVAYR